MPTRLAATADPHHAAKTPAAAPATHSLRTTSASADITTSAASATDTGADAPWLLRGFRSQARMPTTPSGMSTRKVAQAASEEDEGR